MFTRPEYIWIGCVIAVVGAIAVGMAIWQVVT